MCAAWRVTSSGLSKGWQRLLLLRGCHLICSHQSPSAEAEGCLSLTYTDISPFQLGIRQADLSQKAWNEPENSKPQTSLSLEFRNLKHPKLQKSNIEPPKKPNRTPNLTTENRQILCNFQRFTIQNRTSNFLNFRFNYTKTELRTSWTN